MTVEQFECLVENHRAGLVQAGYNVVRDYDDAEDITQEVLLSAWRNREGITEGLPYLLVAMRHRAYNWLKSKGLRPLLFEDHWKGEESAIVSEDPLSIVIQNAEFVLFQALMRRCKLTGKQQNRLMMHYIGGYTHAEIAVREQVHATAITDSIRTAILHLRRARAGGDG